MANGIAALRKIQIGREATAGTAVAATQVLLGKLTMGEILALHRPDEERGSLADIHRTIVAGEDVELTFDGDATFEQLTYLIENAIATVADPGDGGDGDYTRDYDPNLTSANTIKSFTVEYGDNIQAYETEFVATRDIEISGAMDQPWAVKSNMFGRNMSPTTFTAALTAPVVEPILTNLTVLSIDAVGGTIGSTAKASTLVDFSWKLSTGWNPRKHGGAALYFDTLGEAKMKLTCDMTLAFNSAVEAERVIYAAGTRRLFSLVATGTLLGGAAFKTATLEFAGIYNVVGSPGEADGETIVSISIEGEYDPGWGKYVRVEITNGDALL